MGASNRVFWFWFHIISVSIIYLQDCRPGCPLRPLAFQFPCLGTKLCGGYQEVVFCSPQLAGMLVLQPLEGAGMLVLHLLEGAGILVLQGLRDTDMPLIPTLEGPCMLVVYALDGVVVVAFELLEVPPQLLGRFPVLRVQFVEAASIVPYVLLKDQTATLRDQCADDGGMDLCSCGSEFFLSGRCRVCIWREPPVLVPSLTESADANVYQHQGTERVLHPTRHVTMMQVHIHAELLETTIPQQNLIRQAKDASSSEDETNKSEYVNHDEIGFQESCVWWFNATLLAVYRSTHV